MQYLNVSVSRALMRTISGEIYMKDRDFNDAMIPRLLSVKDVIQCTGLSRATIYKLEASADFPAKFSITESRIAWLESDVADWIMERAAGREHRRRVSAKQ